MLLRQLFEEINKPAVLGWGRGMGHKGHMLLAKAVIHHAQENNAKAYFVVSRTSLVDPATGEPWADKPTFTKTKGDPLSPEEKLATYRKVFPQNADVFSVATADASTLDKVLGKIARDGFAKVTLIVGELEKDSFSFLTRPDKSGIPPYQRAGLRDLEIISRQDTSEPSSVKGSPDYQEGPRATPMRTVLTDPTKSEEEQFAVWRDAMPDNLSDDEVMDLMNKAKQRMAAVPAAKNAKKAKQAVAEGTSIESTLRAVINDIGEPITAVYDTMKFQAKKYMENHGELGRGFRMVAAGVGGRWVQSMYVGRLQNELYDLCRYNSRRTVELKQFLRGVETDGEIEIKRSFGNIANELPRILAKLGQYLNAPQLTKNANRWMQNKTAYEEYIANLELEDEYDELEVRPEKNKIPGQQNAQVEQIVNDILAKLPKNIAGDIRNAIARAPNKLQALQQELAKRKIQGVAEGATVTRIDSKPITDFGSSLKAYKHTDDWSQSGVDTGDDSYWKNKNLKTNTTKGLFAGDPKRTALYATGNAHETRYVEFTQDGQPIVYFDRKDLPAMRSRKTYLTVFDARDFGQLPTGEWFSENPSKPIKQVPIGDPFKYIADQGWIVRITNDLDKVFKQVKNMHKAGKIAQYGAEGMNESKQGVAEGLKEMDNRTPSSDREEQRRNRPEEKAKQDKEQQKRLKDTSPEMRKKLRLPEPKEGVAEVSLGNVLPWPEVVNKVNSAMKATGWKGKRMSDDAFMFTTRGAEVEDQWYIAIIDNAGDGFFTYALGTVEEGDPHIDDAFKGRLPNTEASVSELMNEIRDGFGLA